MTEFPRLLLAARTDEARALLVAGVNESPDEQALARAAVALGLNAGLVMGSTSLGVSAAAAALSPTKGIAMVTAKWLAVGALTGGLATSAFLSLSRGPSPQRSVATTGATRAVSLPAPGPARRARAGELPAAAETIERLVGKRAPAPVVLRAVDAGLPRADANEKSRLQAEVLQIDAVRGALAAGDGRTAISLLDQYLSRARTGILDREAKILRIDALVQLGRGVEARALVHAFLRDFPNDPQAARLNGLAATGE